MEAEAEESAEGGAGDPAGEAGLASCSRAPSRSSSPELQPTSVDIVHQGRPIHFDCGALGGDATQFIFDKARPIFMSTRVKEEQDDDEPSEPRQAPPRELKTEQVKLLHKFKAAVWRFDPAQCPQALENYKHLLRRVDVRRLVFTHDEVCTAFRNGAHAQTPVAGLTRQLLTGEATVESITPLVAVKHEGVMRVVFGNRRLKALKDYADQVPHLPVLVRCILHDFDEGQIPSLALFCKWVDASTTVNGGTSVVVRGAHSRQGVAPWQRPPPPPPPRPPPLPRPVSAAAAAVPTGLSSRFQQLRTLAPRRVMPPGAGSSLSPAPAQGP